MALAPFLASGWSARIPAGTFTNNPVFRQWLGGVSSFPDGWNGGAVVGGSTVTKTPPESILPLGYPAANTMTLAGAAGQLAYAGYNYPTTIDVLPGPGFYFLWGVLSLVSGSLDGSFVNFTTGTTPTLSVTPESGIITPATPASNVTVTSLGVGAPSVYSMIARVSDPTSLYVAMGIASHHPVGGSIAVANSIRFSGCGLRPALAAEVAAAYQTEAGGFPVFPIMPGLAPAISKSPRFSTKTKEATSGRERRTAFWPYPKWRFKISNEVLRDRASNPELAALIEFFMTVGGPYSGFFYLDQDDYVVPHGTQFGVGDGTSTVFQLSRFVRSWREPVLAPFAAKLYVNGAILTPGVHYTIGSGGVVTFYAAPAAAALLTWSGGFYFVCRFSDDEMALERMMAGLWGGDLEFETYRA